MIRINTSNGRLHERPIGKHVKVPDAMSDGDPRVPLRGRGHDSRAASVPVSTTRRSVPQISPHKTRRTLHRGTDGSNLDVCGVLPAETQTEARKRASASPSPESTA